MQATLLKKHQEDSELTDYDKEDKKKQAKLKQIREKNENLKQEKLESVMKFPFSFISVGNSRAGKSYSFYNILSEPKYQILDRINSGTDIYIISPTAKLDKSMEKIINLFEKTFSDFMIEEQIFTDVEQGIQAVQNRMKDQLAQTTSKKEIPYLLVILDDCITEFKQPYFQNFVQKLATMGRHYNINFWISTQSYKQLSPIIRRNTTIFSIHNINLQTEQKIISEELRNATISAREFQNLIQKITAQDYGFLLVCQQRKPDEKYLLNGKEVILY